MANIGSEVERALAWRAKKNLEYSALAFERSLELIDLSLQYHTQLSHLKEIARVREVLVDYFLGSNEFGTTEATWKNYFSHFIYAARRDA